MKSLSSFMETIVETLTNLAKPVRITDLQSANETLANLSNQKISEEVYEDFIQNRLIDYKKNKDYKQLLVTNLYFYIKRIYQYFLELHHFLSF